MKALRISAGHCGRLRRVPMWKSSILFTAIPNVTGPVTRYLGDIPNIHLIEPLDYVPFVDLMRRAYLLLTDSGGIQEEGPSLGKPVLVMRDKTERPEAVEAGTVRLAGTGETKIVAEVTRLLDHPTARDAMSLRA